MAEVMFSAEVLEKARGYLRGGSVRRDSDQPQVFWVRGGGNRPYRVQTDADAETGKMTWVSCTCAHGRNIGAGTARCSHAVAALILIREEREAGRIEQTFVSETPEEFPHR